MGTLFLGQIKKQASTFLHEKYKTARLVLSDVTQAELLAEEATNNDPCSPDAKTMTQITQASFDIDDYWRIADILHRRFYSIDLKQWRQYYKSMALLEFLLTHGPEEFAGEFRRDYRTIQELGTFQHTDENGFDWGKTMQMRSERILELLSGGERLKQARLKALKITKEIQGFGSSTPSPSSSSPSKLSNASTFGLNSTSSTPSRWEVGAKTKHDIQHPSAKKGVADSISMGEIESEEFSTPTGDRWNFEGSLGWERDPPPVEESGNLLDSEDEDADGDGDGDGDGKEEEGKKYGFISGICSKFGGKSPSKFIEGEKVAFRSLSDVGKVRRKKVDRQFSKEY